MRYPLSYATGIAIALLIVASFYAGGLWLLALPVIFYIALPVADALAGHSRWPSEHRIARFDTRTARLYDAVLIAAGWTVVATILWAVWAVSSRALAWWEFTLFAIVVGEFSGFVGIVAAHELMHRPGKGHRRLGFLLMALTGYAHFCIEHVRGHHSRVATPDDPATARRSESLYAFIPRSIIGGFRSAWAIEVERLKRAGHPAWSRHNDILVWHGFTIALMIAVAVLLGPLSLGLFVLQGLFAIVALESINYLEHYGLARDRLEDGSYERVRPVHSWNSSHLLTNINLFNLGRHSDHHRQSNRPYYRLRHYDEAPQLPYGYSGSFILSLFPPLWFRVMDRELDSHRDRQASLS